ncbi:serine hydrolase [Nonomuraea sp. WAC 01424]|uniref:serine hydrolase domain-containing protein n=1 Tax=Nonomuraea sp. WAC 01424 TaxID=2203200 RepID=UPI000F7675AB|nr:serine hydrolase domain-containing protein [Nonomuraea sp. WAC 01424]RSN15652.1 serine hydrolase [Nonomuraea sp. WAC 01424]
MSPSHPTRAALTPPPATPRWRRALAPATAAAVALSVLGLAAAPAAAEAGARARPADAVQTALEGLVGAGGFPGTLASTRDRGGRVLDYTAGVADLATRAKVPRNGKVRIGSTTKTFLATLVLQLAGEGKIDLDATVETYLPGLIRANGNDGRRFTVRQALQHTAGLPDYEHDLPGSWPSWTQARHRYFEPRDVLDVGLTRQPAFAPGTGWAYSNTGYIALGLLVQKITGRPLGEEITNRIITPLRLRDTYWPGAGEQNIRGPHPKGYRAKTNEPGAELTEVTQLDPSWAWAAGQMISTPRDVNRFLGALLDGRLLKPDLLQQMKQTIAAPGFPKGWSYGLGLMKIELSCGGHAWAHGGDISGYEVRNGATEDGRAATIAVTAMPYTKSAADQVLAALDTALCAQR